MGNYLIKFWGFVVTFADGSQYSERDGTWLDMPDKLIGQAELHTPGIEPVVLKSFAKYFFNNEAICRMPIGIMSRTVSVKGEVVAKLLGGLDIRDRAIEYRIAKEDNDYKVCSREIEPDAFPYTRNILKGGCYGEKL